MLWIKSFHIIFMVTWFAGLFYLPRLYVYHAGSDDPISNERFKIMERKLFWGITTPGGLITVLTGLWLIAETGGTALLSVLWLQLKLALIVVLIAYHVWCGKLMLDFKYDRNRHSHIWYRWFNEAPTVLLVAIVLLVELQPV